MSSSPSQRMKIGDFLLRRLKEAGVWHLFGVPGDYNLELLQQLQDTGALTWIGTCSELNASYAADGYARLNGLGALLVTNGVGALSAFNGVGGSYSEHIPVICSDQHGQIGDRRDVPALSRHLHRQAKRTACTRGDRDQRLPARHRLSTARGDHGRLAARSAMR